MFSIFYYSLVNTQTFIRFKKRIYNLINIFFYVNNTIWKNDNSGKRVHNTTHDDDNIIYHAFLYVVTVIRIRVVPLDLLPSVGNRCIQARILVHTSRTRTHAHIYTHMQRAHVYTHTHTSKNHTRAMS